LHARNAARDDSSDPQGGTQLRAEFGSIRIGIVRIGA
jgi:hypothetical protein